MDSSFPGPGSAWATIDSCGDSSTRRDAFHRRRKAPPRPTWGHPTRPEPAATSLFSPLPRNRELPQDCASAAPQPRPSCQDDEVAMSAQPKWLATEPSQQTDQADHTASGVDTLLQRCPGRSRQHRQQLLNRLLRARQRIANGDYLGAGVDQVAADCSLSRWYFARVYGRLFDQHPQQALIEARLRRARGLLEQSSWTISEIALHCGFEIPGSLSRVCVQRLGASPSQLRVRAGGSPLAASGAGPTAPEAPPATPAPLPQSRDVGPWRPSAWPPGQDDAPGPGRLRPEP